MKLLRYLDPLVVNWFFAELPDHRNQDYEKEFGEKLDNDTKDYVTELIKYHFPEAEVFIIEKSDPFDYLLVVKTNHGTYCSHAGTHGLKDWLCNTKMIPDKSGMHPGWKKSYARFRDDFKELRPLFGHSHIDFSGHSQGGPGSLYSAKYLKETFGIDSTVWTFESPVPGNDKLTATLSRLGIKCNRVWVPGDPVVIHFQCMGQHYGNSIKMPNAIPLLRFLPMFRVYLHSYSVETRSLRKYFKKQRKHDEVKFLTAMLKRCMI